ncbi:MAG: PD-(D/E)XK nuclease family protein, partial [Campylobacteraceae bacterium]|nr:PD-(D/E)XK nuclease family protein [Campylobacteraceae bacterium]
LKQSDYIFRFFGELAHEMVDIKTLKEADTYEYYGEHLDILQHVHKNYVNLLEKNKCIDKVTLLDHYKINEGYLKQFESIELFFEGYFTKFEFKIINEVAQNKNLIVNLITNEYNKKSWELFVNTGFELEVNKKYCLDISKQEIISVEDFVQKKPNLKIEGFNTRVNQIAYIKTSVTQMINDGLDVKEIVLVLPSESFKDLLELFDDEGYFNYAMGKNIYNSKLYKCLNAIHLYLNDDEKKHLELLEFLDLDVKFIKNEFFMFWNKQLTFAIFEKLTLFLREKETNAEILEKFDEEIYKLNRLLFSTSQNILFKDAYKILLQRISAFSLDDVNGGAITVMGLLETRGVNFKGVVLVDFNEGVVPKRSIKDKFLSTSVKKHANLPTIKDRENLQKYYYEKLIFNASHVAISYTNNEASQISRFAHELFPFFKFSNEVMDNKYEHILYQKHKLSHFNKDISMEVDLSTHTWSATSLKNYLECKRKFYFKYIINIGEHHFSLKPQGFELGSIIHKILEDFYTDDKRLSENASEKLNALFNKQKSNNPFLTYDLEIWKRKLGSFINLEKERFAKGVMVESLEKSFNINYKGFKLKGVIDRIDKTKEGYEIIDYKTSSVLKIDTIKTYEKTKDFQLEFYFLALKETIQDGSLLTPYYYDLNKMQLLKEVVLEQKLDLFDEILNSLKTTKVDFDKCEDKSTCLYCPYSTICDR